MGPVGNVTKWKTLSWSVAGGLTVAGLKSPEIHGDLARVSLAVWVCVCVRRSTSTRSKRERGSVGERYHLSFPSAPVYQWHTHNLSVSFTHTHARFPKHKHINNCCGDQGHILSSVLIFHTWTWLITQVKTWHMCQVIVYASWEITEETTEELQCVCVLLCYWETCLLEM